MFGWEQPGCRSSGRHLGKGALPILIALSCSVFFLLPWIIATAPTHSPGWPLHLQPMQSPELYFKSAKCKPEHNYITPRPSVAPHFFRASYPIPADYASATTSLWPPVLTIAPHAPYQIIVNSLGFPHCVIFSKSTPLLSTLLPLSGAPLPAHPLTKLDNCNLFSQDSA